MGGRASTIVADSEIPPTDIQTSIDGEIEGQDETDQLTTAAGAATVSSAVTVFFGDLIFSYKRHLGYLFPIGIPH